MKKKISAFLSLTVIMFATILFACCKDNQRKYDVTIKLANNFGAEWIFEPDTDRIDFCFKYTGKEMTFYVKEYKLNRHKDLWLEPPRTGVNQIHIISDFIYINPNGEQTLVRSVKERGSYEICAIADGSDWNFRSVRLYVTVVI